MGNFSVHRTACFACTTPYQLIGAISIVKKTDLDADLYLFGSFPNFEEVARRLVKYKVFVDVIIVKSTHKKAISRLNTLWQILNRKNAVKSFLSADIVYDFFYSTSQAHGKLLLLYELRRRNPLIEYVLYEDGMGSYSQGAHQLAGSRYTRMFERIAGSKIFIEGKTSIMVHYPQFLQLPDKIRTIPRHLMPPFDICKENVKMLKSVFYFFEDSLLERIILFDTARGVYRNNLYGLELLDECFYTVMNICSDNIIMKDHPKSKLKFNCNIKRYPRQEIPVEILYACMHDLDNRILIGNFSTALFTPKMLFNKEPIIISLHRVAWKKRKDISDTFEKMATMYLHKERVIAPDSIDELAHYLSAILREKD